MSIEALRQQLFAEQPTGTLYHYTSLGAVKEIVTSRSLFASDIRYFNDAAEIANASDRLMSALYRRTDAVDALGSIVRHPMRSIIEYLRFRLTDAASIYIGSFTANGNLLSQWRGYCPPQRGVSLGFAAEHLSEAAERQEFSVGKCIYEPKEQDKIADTIFDDLEKQFNGMHASDPDFPELMRKVEPDLVRIAALLKHPSFREEQEWRIVSPVLASYVEPPIEYREGKSMLIPFLRFQLPQSAERTVEIQTAYLGPTPHVNQSMNSLSKYLSKAGASPRQGITYCGIPLRES